MFDLDRAVADYQKRCQSSSIADYPMVWAGHYSTRLLGEYGVPTTSDFEEALAHIAFALMAPFGFTEEIQASYLIADGAAVPDYTRNLYVSRLARFQSGVLTTHWVIPYQITDAVTVLGEPRQEIYYGPRLHAALASVSDQRLTPVDRYTFDEAYLACLNQLNKVMK